MTFADNLSGSQRVGTSLVWNGSGNVTHCVPIFNTATTGISLIGGAGGISGYVAAEGTLVHVGVFLGATQPSVAPAPPFYAGLQFLSLLGEAPQLGQLFYVGDGDDLVTETQKKFVVPAGATHVYFGWVDARATVPTDEPFTVSGAPGWYADNVQTIPPGCGADPPVVGGPLTGTVSFESDPVNPDILASERRSPSEPNDCVICEIDPVDTFTGSFAQTETDVSITSRGPDLALRRSYDSRNASTAGDYGAGWTHNLQMRLADNVPATDEVTIYEETGSEIIFNKNANGTYTPSNTRIQATLTSTPSGWRFVRRNVAGYEFNSSGQLIGVKDPAAMAEPAATGQVITRPSSTKMVVTDQSSRSLVLDFHPLYPDRVVKATDPIGRTTNYTYDSTWTYLSSVTDARNQTQSYCYNQNPAEPGCAPFASSQPVGVLRSVTDARGATMVTSYDSAGRVTSQIDRSGQTTTVNYSSSDAGCVVPHSATTALTTPDSSDGNPDIILQSYQNGQLVCDTRTGTGTAPSTEFRTYDPLTGGLSTTTDSLGNTTRIYRDGYGNEIERIDPMGYSTRARFNAFNMPVYQTDGAGTRTDFSYHDEHPWLLTKKSTPVTGTATLQEEFYTYDESATSTFGDLTAMTDANGETWGYEYDSNGYVNVTTDPLDNRTTATFDRVGRATSRISPNGNATSTPDTSFRAVTSFDSSGFDVVNIDELGAGMADSFGRSASAISLGSADTGESWTSVSGTWGVEGATGYLASGTDGMATLSGSPDGALTFTIPESSDGQGVVFRQSSPSNYWRLTAEPSSTNWRLTQVKAGAIAQNLSSPPGTCCESTAVVRVQFSGSTVLVGSSDVGLLFSATDNDLAANTNVGLFSAGSPTNRRGVSSFAFTADPNRQTASVYDENGNKTIQTDSLSQSTSIQYDADDRPTVSSRADGSQISTTYWPNGRMKDQIDGAGSATTYTYDHVGRTQSVTDPAARTVAYDYDAGGRLTRVRTVDNPTACNPKATFGYNANGEMTSVRYGTFTGPTCSAGYTPDPGTPDVVHTYDEVGRRTETVDGTGRTCIEWTSVHRIAAQVTNAGASCASPSPGNVRTVYSHDPRGIVTSILYPGQSTPVLRSHDAAGRVTSVEDWLGTKTWFGYDRNGNQTCMAVSVADTCTSGAASTVRVDYTYDRTNLLVSTGGSDAIEVLGNGSPRASYGYSRDGNGQVTSETTTVGGSTSSHDYTYSSLNQISSATLGGGTDPYSYDAADNVVESGLYGTTTYANDPAYACPPTCTGDANQPYEHTVPVFASTQTYGYDNDGRRTTVLTTTGAGSSSATYNWNKADAMVGLNGVSVNSYDANGLRVKKVAFGATQNFQYDVSEANPQLIRVGSGTNWDNYIYGPDGAPFARINVNGSTSTLTFMAHDQLGSTRLLLDSSGNTIGAYEYTPFGFVGSFGSATTSIQFAGQWADNFFDGGFLYMGSRYYDANSAQFLSRDPLAFLTRAPYSYAGNNPLNMVDPSGMAPELPNPGGIISGLQNARMSAMMLGLIIGVGAIALPGLALPAVLLGALVGGTGIALANFGYISPAEAALDVLLGGIGPLGDDLLSLGKIATGTGQSLQAAGAATRAEGRGARFFLGTLEEANLKVANMGGFLDQCIGVPLRGLGFLLQSLGLSGAVIGAGVDSKNMTEGLVEGQGR